MILGFSDGIGHSYFKSAILLGNIKSQKNKGLSTIWKHFVVGSFVPACVLCIVSDLG
jgi:hypothetical protein